jgi:hypothetical protein
MYGRMKKPKLSFARFRIQLGSLILAASIAIGYIESSHADVGHDFGFGSRVAGIGGAAAAWGFEGFAAYHNPAGLSSTEAKKLNVSWSLLHMDPQFTPIQNVVVENSYLSDKVRSANVADDYRSTFGQALSLQSHPLENFYQLGFGLVFFLPLEQLAYIDTGHPFVPEYFMYRARTQRPQFEFGASASPFDHLSVGAGVHMGYTLTSNASVFLNTAAEKPSWMRFTTALTPKLAPYFGILFRSDSKTSESEKSLSLSKPMLTGAAVVRLPLAASNALYLNSGARVFGSFAAVDFNFSALSALFYDPLKVELGLTLQPIEWFRLFLQADFEAWSKYESPTLTIQDPAVTCANADATACGIQISGGKTPALPLRNLWVPRVGTEINFSEKITGRLGYFYWPGLFSSLPTGAGNYLDPPKHSVTIGAGYDFKNLFSIADSTRLDAHFTYQALKTQVIAKAAGDEATQGDGDLKIGAPGYSAGGRVLGGGLSFSFLF